MTNEQLLDEVEDLLRTMPPRGTIRHDSEENHSWFGRLSAVVNLWNPVNGALLRMYLAPVFRSDATAAGEALKKVLTLLNEARFDLRMKTVGPISVALPRGSVFDYFDEIRKIISAAKQDLLFVDPYLNAEFVSRYLGHVSADVTTRLLTQKALNTLLPAVELFATQSGSRIEVRSASTLHDRYIFVDQTACYQSGASFKDGGRTAPTTLTQITDAFLAMSETYESIWNAGKVEFSK